ncbi:hypothetical protein ILYODFUR_018224 [Ilyodon furcidens]|uniref:Uncharacterized protein n=1 Tax=Ilyodon furcidens TaxID=33524 RepID=A0ABV0VEZ1_9TELE
MDYEYTSGTPPERRALLRGSACSTSSEMVELKQKEIYELSDTIIHSLPSSVCFCYEVVSSQSTKTIHAAWQEFKHLKHTDLSVWKRGQGGFDSLNPCLFTRAMSSPQSLFDHPEHDSGCSQTWF